MSRVWPEPTSNTDRNSIWIVKRYTELPGSNIRSVAAESSQAVEDQPAQELHEAASNVPAPDFSPPGAVLITPQTREVPNPCSQGCGRPKFGRFHTCCTRCKGPEGPHARDCFQKMQQAMCQAADQAKHKQGVVKVCLFAEVGGDERHGGWPSSLDSTWTLEKSCFSWGPGKHGVFYEMSCWCTTITTGRLELPETMTAETVFGIASNTSAITLSNNMGLEFDKRVGKLKSGVKAWRDRDYVYHDVPEEMTGWTFFEGLHKVTPPGTLFVIQVDDSFCPERPLEVHSFSQEEAGNQSSLQEEHLYTISHVDGFGLRLSEQRNAHSFCVEASALGGANVWKLTPERHLPQGYVRVSYWCPSSPAHGFGLTNHERRNASMCPVIIHRVRQECHDRDHPCWRLGEERCGIGDAFTLRMCSDVEGTNGYLLTAELEQGGSTLGVVTRSPKREEAGDVLRSMPSTPTVDSYLSGHGVIIPRDKHRLAECSPLSKCCLLIVVIIVLSLVASSFPKVKQNHWGLSRNTATKTVDLTRIYEPGVYAKTVWHTFHQFPSTLGTIQYAFDKPEEGVQKIAPLAARSKDRVAVSLEVSVQYVRRRDELPDLFRKAQTHQQQENLFISVLRARLIKVMSQHKASDCWERRRSFVSKMLAACKEALVTVHADCWDLQFYRSRMGEKYEAALVNTQVEKQQAKIHKARRQAALVRAQTEVQVEKIKKDIRVFEATQLADRFTIITATQTVATAEKAMAEANVSESVLGTVRQVDGRTLTAKELQRYQQLIMLGHDLPKAPVFKSLSPSTPQVVAKPRAAENEEL